MKRAIQLILLISFLWLKSFVATAQDTLTDFRVVQLSGSSEIYLIIDREKRTLNDNINYSSLFKEKTRIDSLNSNALDSISSGKIINKLFLSKGTGPAVYLVLNKKKYHITSPDAFNFYNFDWGKILTVSDKELIKWKNGKPIGYPKLTSSKIDFPLPCGVKDNYPQQLGK